MFSNRDESNFAENRYYKINKILLSILKLWPYHRSKFTKIYHILYFTIMLSFIFFQLTSFFTYQITMEFIVTVLSYAVPASVYIIQYYSFYAKPNTVKRMWNDIHNIWNILKNETERDIMRQYSSSVSIIGSIVLYGFILFLPTILDIILPLNETRPLISYAVTEYFVDKRTYYHAMLCHWLIGTGVGAFTVLSTFTLHMVYLEYICGLLKITSYRIEHLIDEYVVRDPSQKENCTALQNINSAVNLHRQAFECCEFITNAFALTFALIITIGVTSLSLNLFRLLNAVISLKSIIELISSFLFVCFHFVLMFLGNYYGQKVTDHNDEIFHNTYNLQWYMAPVNIQKLLLFIMKNTTKAYIFNVGNIIMASIEGFSKLSSMSISYFAVIYSLQS